MNLNLYLFRGTFRLNMIILDWHQCNEISVRTFLTVMEMLANLKMLAIRKIRVSYKLSFLSLNSHNPVTKISQGI